MYASVATSTYGGMISAAKEGEQAYPMTAIGRVGACTLLVAFVANERQTCAVHGASLPVLWLAALRGAGPRQDVIFSANARVQSGEKSGSLVNYAKRA